MARRKKVTATNRRNSNADPLALILESLQDGLELHSPQLASRGRGYFGSVGDFTWQEDRVLLQCPVRGSLREPYIVSLYFEEALGQFDAAWCTCPYSDETSLCKHTFAATWVLQQKLTDRLSPLAQRLFGMGNASAPWKNILGELDNLLATWQRRDEVGQQIAEQAEARRITWRIGEFQGYNRHSLLIVPYEQKLRKNGNWSAGKRTTTERLVRDPALVNTPADRAIFDLLLRDNLEYSSYYYSNSQSMDEKLQLELLTLLIGHPLVSWESNNHPVKVRSGVFGLGVKSGKNGLGLEPQIDGVSLGEQTQIMIQSADPPREAIVLLDQVADEIVLATCEPGTLKFLQTLERTKATIPREQQEELLGRLAKIEMKLPVALPEKLLGGTAAADERSFLRLTPQAPSGVKVELRVRPAAEGMLLEPGSGPPTLTAVENELRVAIKRDLPGELSRAHTMSEQLGLAELLPEKPWTWNIERDEAALDLIAQVQDYAAQQSDLVLLWPEGAQITISREVTTQALKVEIEDRKDWFGLKGMIEIDGQQVPLADLLAAVRNGSRYVALGKHKWVRIAQAFRERLAALADIVQPTRSGLEIDTTAAFVAGDLLSDEAVIKASRRWREVIKRLDDSTDLSPEPPITLTAELRDYQLEGYRWLRRLAAWGVGGCLADDMGLGKTVQTLAVLLDRIEEGPSLVVAPTSVAFNWVREADRFAPTMRTTLYRETDRGEFLSQLGEGDLLIASYGLLQRDAEKLAAVKWGTVVLDEAQKVKNSQTKTAQAVRELDAKWRLALTGTPVENHLGELWSMFRAISPGLLGSWERFRERFAEPIERHKDAGRRHALARTVRPFILRRTKSEVLSELPQRTETQLTAELSPKERKLYDDARLSAISKLTGSVAAAGAKGKDARFEVLAALTRLRQLACHPRLVDAAWKEHSAKLELFLEVVEELREGNHRALVFSQFTQHLALLREVLDEREIPYRYLDGGTPAKQREVEVDAFQRGDGDLFLISLKAGGTGLNLTAADYVIHMDPWWNPAVEDQATDRAHRIGQTRPVTVYRLVAKDTIEEQILALHADKRNLVAGVLEGADQAGKLSTEELISLIRDQAGPEAEGRGATSSPKPAGREKVGSGSIALPAPTGRRKPAARAASNKGRTTPRAKR